jgi:hypothetical protein
LIYSLLRDSQALLRKDTPAVAAVISVVATCTFLTEMHAESTARASIVLLGAAIAFCSLFFFGVAASVRTIRPSFQLTIQYFLGFIAYVLLGGILSSLIPSLFMMSAVWCEIACRPLTVKILIILIFLAYIGPGFWIAFRLLPASFVLLLKPGGKPLQLSWAMTTGKDWKTFRTMLLIVSACVAFALSGALIAERVLSLPICAPVCLLVGFILIGWAVYILALGMVRVTVGLLDRRSTGMHGDFSMREG